MRRSPARWCGSAALGPDATMVSNAGRSNPPGAAPTRWPRRPRVPRRPGAPRRRPPRPPASSAAADLARVSSSNPSLTARRSSTSRSVGRRPVGGVAEPAPPGVMRGDADVPRLEADRRGVEPAQILHQRVVVAAGHQVSVEAGAGLQGVLTRTHRFLVAGIHQQIDSRRRHHQYAGAAEVVRQVALVRRLGDDERVQLCVGQARAEPRQPDAQDRGWRQ